MDGWQRFAELASAPVRTTVVGRVHSAEIGVTEHVTFAPPDRWRIADAAGRLRFLADDDAWYRYDEVGTLAEFRPRSPGTWYSGMMESTTLIHPRDLLTSTHDYDFTAPLGPVDEVTHLDRAALRVTLAPPAHKPRPVVQYLDLASGVTLAYTTVDGEPLIGFTEIATGVALPPGTFRPL